MNLDVTHWTYWMAWIAVILIVAIGHLYNRIRPPAGAVIPRAKGEPPGGCNPEGLLIEEDTCPACGEHGFYMGPAKALYQTIYCGNRKCRAAWMVVNYGPGQVWAHRDEGSGPQHL